jgi:hypothetical protein
MGDIEDTFCIVSSADAGMGDIEDTFCIVSSADAGMDIAYKPVIFAFDAQKQESKPQEKTTVLSQKRIEPVRNSGRN